MEIIIITLFGISILMLLNSMNRYRKFKIPSYKEQEKYKSIAKKQVEHRTEDEQDFYIQLQESIFSLLAAKYSFYFGTFLLSFIFIERI